jgi:hypothetical protein
MSNSDYRDEWDAMWEVTRCPVPTPAEHDEHTALVAEIERLRGALGAERATVAALRASVPPVYPSDYGHEVWSAALVEAKKEGARSAVAERAAERAAVVAYLRDCDSLCREWDGRANAVSGTYRLAADVIEHGEHRREETE